MPDFLPRRDDEIVRWSANFSRRISAEPGRYWLTAEQAEAYQALQGRFAELYEVATRNDARTPVGIAAKDRARAELVRLTRELAGVVRARPEVSDAERISLGLRPRPRKSRARTGPPRVAPRIGIVSVVGQAVRLRLRDAESARPFAKPRGVAAAAVFVHIGDEAPAKPSAWKLYRLTSRTVVEVRFNRPIPPGTRVWLTAQWLNRRGEHGPASDPIWTYLLGGVIVPGGRLAA